MTSDTIGPYRLIRQLGVGGMGYVHLAEDTRLGRRVALKQLHGDALAPDARKRLLHEARAAATLNHPNIGAIYDVFEEGDRACLVLEYVEGESLADRVQRGRRPSPEVLDVAVQLADALAEAHAHGIIHRDLKPANIRVTPAGRVKVLDFGIAKVLRPESADRATATVTLAGGLIGTVAYMAPEQLLGAPGDQRTDIYSLGIVLYQLLTGRLPFEERDVVGRTLAALTEHPPAPDAVEPTVPAGLSAAVMRALEREPDARFQSITEFRDALPAPGTAAAVTLPPTGVAFPSPSTAPAKPRARRWLPVAVTAGLLVAAAIAGGFWWRGRSHMPAGTAAAPVVAVPALANLSGDARQDYLGVGMSETLNTALARLSGVSVVARGDVQDARRQGADSAKIASLVGASYVVDGGVQQSGDRLRVTLKLVRPDGTVAWADAFEGTLPALFELQGRMVSGLTAALQVALSEADRARLSSLQMPDGPSLPDYWTGRTLLENRQIPGNVQRAVTLLEGVAHENPRVAVAHAALGEAYWQRYEETTDPSWTEKAIASCLTALRLDPDQPGVRYALAVIYRGSGRTQEALEELDRVFALQPLNVEGRVLRGVILGDQGKVDEAVADFDRAAALRPGYSGTWSERGKVLWKAGRNQEAAEAFRKVTELAPESPVGYQALGSVYHTMGDRPRALDNYERAIALGPSPSAYTNLGTLLYEQGEYAKAAHAFERAIELAPPSDIRQRNLGDVYAKLGRTADARRAYERAATLAQERLKVNAADAESLARLAVYEAKLGRARDARRHAEQAVTLAPSSGRVQYYLAVTCALVGEHARSLEAVRAAVAGGVSLGRVREDEDLAALRRLPEFQAAFGTGAPR